MQRVKPALSVALLLTLVLTALQASLATPAVAQVSAGGIQNVSRDNADSLRPRVAQDPDGNLHVVWDSGEGSRVVRYAKGIWNGANYTFGNTYIVADVGSSQYATPSVAIAPNGAIMVAWSAADGVYFQVWDARGDRPSGGPTFLGRGIQTSIAVDSSSHFHIAWNGDFKVQYCEFDGSGCRNRDAFADNGNRPDIAVDSNDGVHLVWDRSGAFYRARPANAGWGDIQRLGDGITAQIAPDGQGSVHIVWSRDYNIQYCRRTLGSGCADGHTLDAAADLEPSIGVTRGGTVVVAFRDADFKQLWYDVRESGRWIGSRQIGGGPTAVDVVARPYADRVSLVWSLDYEIQLVTASPGGQPAPTPPPAPTPAPPPADARVFPETGQYISGRIRQYWEGNGGLPIFGLPLNAQAQRRTLDGTFQMQLFERNRLELHPENRAPYDVLLGRLGGDILYAQGRPWETLPREQPRPGCRFFAETQHNLCEPFLSYWRANGLDLGDPGVSERESLALFGLPLTTAATETNRDGFTGLTQWFERARFEYYPNNPPAFRIQLGRLGAESGQQ